MKTPKEVVLSKMGGACLHPDGRLYIEQFNGSLSICLSSEDFQEIIKLSKEESLQFPELPEGESWHNPDNLTPEQVEVDKGWRLLTKSERKRRALSSEEIYDCSGWGDASKSWGNEHLFGASPHITYRTKTPPKGLSSSDKAQEPEINAERSHSIDLIGRRHTAEFLRKCRVIVLENPMDEPDPFGTPGKLIVLNFGKKEGWGEINPDMEFESYLDGKTFKVRNIVSITP